MKPAPNWRVAACSFFLLIVLAFPSLLAAQKVVSLSWTPDQDQVAGYNVYRGDVSGGPYAKVNTSLDPNTIYTDSTVLPSHRYYYVTTAVNSLGQESTYSNESTVTVPNGGGGSEVTLYGFSGSSGPSQPMAGLTFDKNGNLYGTTKMGGTYSQGTVFEMTPGSGGWTQTILYNFTGGHDGAQPSAELLFDASGNLYGTTTAGGTGSCSAGCGTVFELTPSSGGWTETVLYAFSGGNDGSNPYAPVVFDTAGSLYGTTIQGGTIGSNCSAGCGVVFRLTPASGTWNESVLYSFAGGNDGSYPYASVIADASGSWYGTTSAGGSYGKGTVYKLTSGSSGWTETLLHTMTGGLDGSSPYGPVVLDAAGILYGTAIQGGSAGYGVVFEILPNSHGGWRERVIHNFGNAPSANPASALMFDPSGNLYGTTQQGGGLTSCGGGCGTLFKMSPGANGAWTFTVRHLFGRGADGYRPNGRLVQDSSGNLYGTTQAGGPQGAGVVFKTAP